MATRWLYTEEGKPAFYQEEENIFSPDGNRAYYEADGWWCRHEDGQASYYVADGWIYTPNGKGTFYYG